MSGTEYPKRSKFYSNRFCRILTKSAAAQEIGAEACWLLTVVAHQEDSKRYKGAVTYWNEQLAPLCGFGGRSRLVHARDKAVAAGWLHYEAGARGRPGRYWTTIPHQYEDLGDGPMDESSDDFLRTEIGRQVEAIPSRNGTANRTSSGTPDNYSVPKQDAIRTESGRNPDFIRTLSGRNPDGIPAPSLPIPNPSPDPIPKYIPPPFDQWWEVWPKKVAKLDAAKAFPKAIATVATKYRMTPEAALDHLILKTAQFATSDKANGLFCPHPATWLNQGCYDDDQKYWKDHDSNSKHDSPRVGPGQRFKS